MTVQATSLQFGQFSLKSPYRDLNGDAIFTEMLKGDGGLGHSEAGMFMVWSGLGGSQVSSRAGKVIIQTITKEFNRHTVIPFLETSAFPDNKNVTRTMVNAFQEANQRVLSEVPLGGGSLTAAIVTDKQYHVFHVGDTQAFLVQEDEITQLTQVHDFVQALIDAGHFESRKEVWDKANAVDNKVYNAFGQQETLNKIEIISQTLKDKMGLLLYSRGLPLYLPEDRIEIQQIINESQNAQDTCQRLINLINQRDLTGDASAVFIAHDLLFKP